jgi:hypothetical protein
MPIRDFGKAVLGGGALITGALTAQRLFGSEARSQQTIGVADFLVNRNLLDPKKSYLPPNPEEPLSQEITDKIFDDLALAENYPDTINKSAFHAIAQKPARVASLYLQKEGGITEDEFGEHCKGFFKKMYETSQEMRVDFIAILLMFQISGDANSSVMAERGDVMDEAVRTGLTLADSVVGSSAA